MTNNLNITSIYFTPKLLYNAMVNSAENLECSLGLVSMTYLGNVLGDTREIVPPISNYVCNNNERAPYSKGYPRYLDRQTATSGNEGQGGGAVYWQNVGQRAGNYLQELNLDAS